MTRLSLLQTVPLLVRQIMLFGVFQSQIEHTFAIFVNSQYILYKTKGKTKTKHAKG